jgi:hypothetical protein
LRARKLTVAPSRSGMSAGFGFLFIAHGGLSSQDAATDAAMGAKAAGSSRQKLR